MDELIGYDAPPIELPFFTEVQRNAGCLKIGLLSSVPEGWNEETALHPDCEADVNDAVQLCDDLRHNVEKVSAVQLSYPELVQTHPLIFSCFVGHAVAYWEQVL